jgi:PKD repeat protein
MPLKKLLSFCVVFVWFFACYSQQIWLYTPLNKAVIVDSSVTLSWRKAVSSQSYEVELSTDSLFSNPITYQTTSTSIILNNLQYDTYYYWRVRGNNGSFGLFRSFKKLNLYNAGPLELWFRADRGVVFDSTSFRVSKWSDQSPMARNATQTSFNLQPIYNLALYNGLPALTFGNQGLNNLFTQLDFSSFSMPGELCFFSIWRLLSNSRPLHYVVGGSGQGVFAGGTASTLNNSGMIGTAVLSSSGPVNLTLNQTTMRKFEIRRNGVNLITSGSVGTPTLNTLGRRLDNSNLFLHGVLPEVILFSSNLPDSIRNQIEVYLATKYSRVVRLPSDTIVCGPSLPLSISGGADEYSSILWNTGATGTSITVTQNGTYWVRVVGRLGYTTTDTIRVGGILPNPIITPTATQTICTTRDSVTLRNLSANPNYTFQWSTGSTADSIRVTNVDFYYLQAVDAPSGCILTSDTVELIHKTIADFANPAACPEVDAHFDDLSIDLQQDTIVFWNWNFGDPSTTQDVSTDTNGVWNYAQSNTYPVYLRIQTSDGCADSIVKSVLIKPTATANFSWQGPCYGKPTQFFDNSVPENGTQVTGYQWNLGPGLSSSFVNPAVTYTSEGVYPVTLTVFTASGCQEALTRQVPVNKGANANFSLPDSVCTGQSLSIQEESTGVNDEITQWIWRFGNNVPISGQNPNFAFQTSGSRIVRLTVTTSAGCSDSAQAGVWVSPTPNAAFSLASGGGNPPATAAVTNSSTGALDYTWLLNGDFFSSEITPTFPAWNDTGLYVISLITENQYGCTDSMSRIFTVFTGERSLKLTDAQCEKEGEYMKYRARILNNGVLEVNQIRLSASVNYENTLQENWTGSLLPGQELNYVFTGSPKLFGSDEFCCVQIDNYNDTLTVTPPDDRLCKALDNGPWFSLPYPNPAESSFTLDFVLPFADKLSIRLADAGGKDLDHVVKNQSFGAGFHTVTHDFSELRGGMYFLKIFYRDRIFRMKVVKR